MALKGIKCWPRGVDYFPDISVDVAYHAFEWDENMVEKLWDVIMLWCLIGRIFCGNIENEM